jgi:UDP-N-acetylmuramyl pentapeptide phosphotransferase/UDP-N-acetylglucosamine-1-phosphate transferase
MDLDKAILISIPLILLFNFFIFENYNFFFLKRTKDKQFYKPQAFHLKPTPRIGGFLIFIFLTIFLIFSFYKNIFFYKIFFLGSFFFSIGFMEDLNFRIKPEIRLIFMSFFSFFLIYFLDVKIFDTQIPFLNNLINNHKIISSVFVCLCLLFVINGCNFIDGFNGLLIIHSIIILGILYFINLQNSSFEHLKYFILFFIIICLSVLFYNFPRAKIFLGDGGAYFLGSTISLVAIELSNLNKMISPFFFACILFYIFFEVFFSFFRKIFIHRSSPLKPDKKHMHMLIFKFIYSKVKNVEKANYLTGLLLNIFYILLITPLLFYYQDRTFCEIYFMFLLFIYLVCYSYLIKKYK